MNELLKPIQLVASIIVGITLTLSTLDPVLGRPMGPSGKPSVLSYTSQQNDRQQNTGLDIAPEGSDPGACDSSGQLCAASHGPLGQGSAGAQSLLSEGQFADRRWNIRFHHGWGNQNDRSGVIASAKARALCDGGSPSGLDVHLSLLLNRACTPTEVISLSGWLVHSGFFSYDTSHSNMWASPDGVKKYAWGSVTSEGLGVPADLLSPSNGTRTDSLRPAFDWSDVDGATSYTLQISRTSTFGSVLAGANPKTSYYQLTSDLPSNSKLYWRVRVNGVYPQYWSNQTWSFSTPNPPSIPSPLSPAKNALLTDYTPLFRWSLSSIPYGTVFDHYQLQVDNDSAFGNPEVDVDVNTLGSPQYESSVDLPANTRYYWRVRSFNSAGEFSSWSAIRFLRTALLPPALVGPTDGSMPETLRPTFDWEDVPGARSYTIVVSKYPNYSSPLLSVISAGSAYTPTKNLYPNITNYWRVRANGTNTSAWTTNYFTGPNPPGIPGLVSPANAALSTDYTPRLDWADSSLPAGTTFDRYRLQVAADSVFSALVLDQDLPGLASSEYTFPANLPSNARFYWRVRAFNTLGQYSAWSVVRYFKTAMLPPVILAPAPGSTPPTLRPTLDWEDVPGATSYTIVISKYANYASPRVNVTVWGSTYAPSKDVYASTTNYWRVRANGANGASLWSRSSFVGPNPPTKPTLLSPASNSLFTGYSPVSLVWSLDTVPADFSHYQLQVATDTIFSAILVDTTQPSARYSLPISPNTTYYWHVRAYNQLNQYSGWSAMYSLRAAVLPPELLSPAAGSTPEDLRPFFDWSDVAGASSYTLIVSMYPDYSSPILNLRVSASSYTSTNNLPARTIFYWRVRANAANGPSAWAGGSFFGPIPPSVPAPLSPASNSLSTSSSELLEWGRSISAYPKVIDHYQLQVDTNSSSFASPEVDQAVVGTSHTLALNPGDVFYWRVRAHDSAGQSSAWSAVWSLGAKMLAPALISPVDGIIVTNPVSFDWGDVTGATDYTLQVSAVSSFSGFLLDTTLGESNYSMATDLPAGQTLYWRVRGNGTAGPSDWSAVSSFALPPVDIVSEIIGRVERDMTVADLQRLTGDAPVCDENGCRTISNRLTGSSGLAWAKDYVEGELSGLGYAVGVFDWSRSGYADQDIIVRKPGASRPDEEIYFVAHLDGVGGSGPAADDDASGVVDLLQLARILKDYSFDRTIVLFFSTGEEQGALGSRSYIDQLAPEEIGNIKYVVDVDMVGYDANHDGSMELWHGGHSPSLELAELFGDAIGDYQFKLVPEFAVGCG